MATQADDAQPAKTTQNDPCAFEHKALFVFKPISCFCDEECSCKWTPTQNCVCIMSVRFEKKVHLIEKQ